MATVLVLEDIPYVRKVFTTILRLDGYTVLESETVAEARRVERKFSGTLDLLIASVFLPGGESGIQGAVKLRSSNPNLRILFASGTAIDQWPESDRRKLESLPTGSYAFLPKPFTRVELRQKVQQLLDGANVATV